MSICQVFLEYTILTFTFSHHFLSSYLHLDFLMKGLIVADFLEGKFAVFEQKRLSVYMRPVLWLRGKEWDLNNNKLTLNF